MTLDEIKEKYGYGVYQKDAYDVQTAKMMVNTIKSKFNQKMDYLESTMKPDSSGNVSQKFISLAKKMAKAVGVGGGGVI